MADFHPLGTSKWLISTLWGPPLGARLDHHWVPGWTTIGCLVVHGWQCSLVVHGWQCSLVVYFWQCSLVVYFWHFSRI